MQFINNGPNVPDELLQAHKEGRVIFFVVQVFLFQQDFQHSKCLVDKIYKNLGDTHSENENIAYQKMQYDSMLDLLEHRIVGQRIAIRKALVKSLKPKLKLLGALDIHKALFQLAQCSDGSLRLVTTNFDRLFEICCPKP
ncbi:hypothetical protein [Acinetobacter sp. ESBL14]|uniref:hypothetical protein n=1 Tax=Acinetobacter sp. ESBL14 TaxID=3077329 RepID=UPI002FC7E27B